MGGYLENVKNRISKYDTSLNTVFRFEFPEQDVLYVCFGNFQWISPSNTCSVFWFEHIHVFCINSIIWQCALQTYEFFLWTNMLFCLAWTWPLIASFMLSSSCIGRIRFWNAGFSDLSPVCKPLRSSVMQGFDFHSICWKKDCRIADPMAEQ